LQSCICCSEIVHNSSHDKQNEHEIKTFSYQTNCAPWMGPPQCRDSFT
jgi:hypothetical protein